MVLVFPAGTDLFYSEVMDLALQLSVPVMQVLQSAMPQQELP